MTIKVIPIKFNQEDLRYLRELQDHLNLTDTYGADPRSIKIAIKIAIFYLLKEEKNLLNKVIPYLNNNEIEIIFSREQDLIKPKILEKIRQFKQKDPI